MIQVSPTQLKKMLVDDGVISDQSFDEVMTQSKRMDQSVVDILTSKGIVTTDYYYNLLAKYFGVERISFLTHRIDEQALKILPEKIAREKNIILFEKGEDGSLSVAMTDPSDVNTIEFLKKKLGVAIKSFLATEDDLNKGFALYGKQSSEDFRKVIEDNIKLSVQQKILEKEAKEAAAEVPIVAIVENLISYAASVNASDIHLEILEDTILVRYRMDGILHEIVKIPKSVHSSLTARIKLLSNLRLDEHAKPQDGRFRYTIGNSFVDIRVSIIPTFFGEKVEMRLLTSASRPLSFQELGMLGETSKIIDKAIEKAYGLLLITGPTGSGKTTTLYSLLNIVNKTDVNIVTIEDPIEYNMKYINQTQVNNTAGITFASGLRSILRQDPDIIMVGEIRDGETAEIAIDSALTGHRVFSSLHTNDAPTSIPRLIDMKVPNFLVSAVMNAVLAQRLVRRICLNCIVSYEPGEKIVDSVKEQFKALGAEDRFIPPKTLFRSIGCDSCGGTGFKGRVGIFEVLEVDEGIREIIVDPNFSLDSLKNYLKTVGFKTMFEDGFEKAKVGVTTIEEVLRVIRE
jgi:type IV pilus assembly protein PilB